MIGCHGSVNKPPFSIGTNLTKVESDDGPILLRMHESICGREGKTLISANQARAAGHVVDDVPKKYHGKQRIKLFDGPTIPLIYRQGLCHMKTSYPSDQDLQTLPVYDLTLDIPWNPAHEFDEDDGIAPSDPRDLNIFATKYIMLSDDAEIQDDVIAEAAASHNDSYFRWTATINKLTITLLVVAAIAVAAAFFVFNRLDGAIAEMIETVVGLMRPAARKNETVLEADLEELCITRLNNDANRIKQVMLNLIGNAIKFTRNGTITVKVRSEVNATGSGINQSRSLNDQQLTINSSIN